MLKLPEITLIALTSKDYAGHKLALDKASEGIEWGARKIIMDYSCTSIDEWNRKIVYELWRYVQTPFAFLFHADGYPIHPECWDSKWLELDYLGSPWPLPTDDYSYRDEVGEIQRVGNSVSLRSRKLMELIATRPVEWFWEQGRRYGNTNEDGFISCHNRKWLEAQGCKFGSFEQALRFGKEAELPENQGLSTFCFHTHG